MTARPAVGLRPAGPDDEPFLVSLYAQTRASEMAATGWGQREIDAFVQMQYAAQRSDYEGRYPAASHSVVLADDRPVGRIWIDRSPDEIRLLDLAVIDGDRDRGIGTRLLRDLQAEAQPAGVPLRHSVVKTNVDALRLYQRLGFTIVGDLPTHHLMEWVGPSCPGRHYGVGCENTAS